MHCRSVYSSTNTITISEASSVRQTLSKGKGNRFRLHPHSQLHFVIFRMRLLEKTKQCKLLIVDADEGEIEYTENEPAKQLLAPLSTTTSVAPSLLALLHDRTCIRDMIITSDSHALHHTFLHRLSEATRNHNTPITCVSPVEKSTRCGAFFLHDSDGIQLSRYIQDNLWNPTRQ